MGTVEAVEDGRVRVNWQDEILEPYLDLKEAQRFRVEDEPEEEEEENGGAEANGMEGLEEEAEPQGSNDPKPR